MTIETILPIADGTYTFAVDSQGNYVLPTQIFQGKGYWVSDDSGVVIEGHITQAGLNDALWLMNVQPLEAIGIWTDPETNLTYIDRSYHFLRKEVAIDFGNLYNQKAIWDCQEKEAINL